jgi:hypothetical protein
MAGPEPLLPADFSLEQTLKDLLQAAPTTTDPSSLARAPPDAQPGARQLREPASSATAGNHAASPPVLQLPACPDDLQPPVLSGMAHIAPLQHPGSPSAFELEPSVVSV